MKNKRMLRCGVCNVDIPDGDWDKHVKSEQHQQYLKNPALLNTLFRENQANLFRAMIGARQTHVKPNDQIDKNNADDLWNWHIAVRGAGGDIHEIRENVRAIFQFLRSKYGQDDYRTLHIQRILDRDLFDVQELEDTRYIIHAEAAGITHETDNVHGQWLKTLKNGSSRI